MIVKVLIWIGSLIIATVLNVIIGYATGIMAGSVLLYIVICLVANFLCRKWDDYRYSREQAEPVYPGVDTSADNNEVQFCGQCGERLIKNSKFCGKCGAEVKNEPVVQKVPELRNSHQCECGEIFYGMFCPVCGKKPKD